MPWCLKGSKTSKPMLASAQPWSKRSSRMIQIHPGRLLNTHASLWHRFPPLSPDPFLSSQSLLMQLPRQHHPLPTSELNLCPGAEWYGSAAVQTLPKLPPKSGTGYPHTLEYIALNSRNPIAQQYIVTRHSTCTIASYGFARLSLQIGGTKMGSCWHLRCPDTSP